MIRVGLIMRYYDSKRALCCVERVGCDDKGRTYHEIL